MKTLQVALFIIVLTLTARSAIADLPLYHVTDLGTDWGRREAYAINDLSQVVGYTTLYNGVIHAFLWDNGILTDLGESFQDAEESYACSINNNGQVVGYGNLKYPSSRDVYYDAALLWDKGTITDIGRLDDASRMNYAYSINDVGQIVGSSKTDIRPYPPHAFLYENGVMTDLGSLKGEDGGSWAYAINNSGQVVGKSKVVGDSIYSDDDHAFLWDNGVMIDLGILADGSDFSEARDINDLGQVVGYADIPSEIPRDTDPYRAFLWDNGHMMDLGTLPDSIGSIAEAINNTGQVVGTSYGIFDHFNTEQAFFWDQTHGIMKLNDLLDDSSEGWDLIEAYDINNLGQIVGYGINPGKDGVHAFLLTPVPEPVSLTLLALGGLPLIKRRR